MAALSLSARGSRMEVKDSKDLSARPPETTRLAEDRSGRSEIVSSSEMNLIGPIKRVRRYQIDIHSGSGMRVGERVCIN